MELSKKLSKNMKTLRGSKSQAAFSKEIGIAKATVNSIETQRASIRLDTLEVICLHLGIPPQSLLSDEMDCMESGMLEYLLGRTEWYLKLSPEDQQAYIQWLRHTATCLNVSLDKIRNGRNDRYGLPRHFAPAWDYTKL